MEAQDGVINESEEQVLQCKNGHVVNGVTVDIYNERFDGKVCDCGLLMYYKENCSCPNSPGFKIQSKQNGS